jgi:hypothetical protein
MIYFNRFHVRSASSAGLPYCRTPGCGHILTTHIGHNLALLDYQLHDNPLATLKFNCSVCGRTSEYDYPSPLRIMPPGTGPATLPDTAKWAVILLELPTTATMPERAFLGERVLIRDMLEKSLGWIAGVRISACTISTSWKHASRTDSKRLLCLQWRVCRQRESRVATD